MTGRIGLLSLLLGVAFTLNSCMDYEDIELVEISSIDFEEVSGEQIKVNISALIKNPNAYPITIVKTDLGIYLANKKVGTAFLDKKMKLPKNSKLVQTFSFKTDASTLKKSILPSLASVLSTSSIAVRIRGSIKARIVVAGATFNVDFSDTVKVSDLF